MGVQSIKVPIQLEVQQLQGSINYIKRALDKLDPGTNLYKSLEKGLNKVIQQMNALEVESKQSFGSVKEIENFEKNFNKVGTSVQELGNLLNKVSFSDLGKIFSKDDLQPIEDARNEIDKLQKNISKIKTDKMFELTRSSKDFGDIITNLGVNTFDKAVSGIEQRVKELTKSIDSAEASLSGLQNTFLTNKDLSEKYNKVSSFDEIKKNFLASYQKDGKQLLRFKAGGREQLTNILQGMGFDDATLEQVKKVSIDKLEELFQSLEKEINKKVDIQNKSLQKAQDNYKKAFAEQETRTNLRADYNTALDQLRDIEIDPTLQSTIDNLNDKIEEQEQKIIDLQKQLLITSGIQQDGIKAQQQATDTIEKGTKAIRAQADAAQEQAKAQELLSDIKFAIKNWFGFNEVINLTKNAVRNMITQIRELDDVMTQIAIVTDMTQKELWDQMDTYSAMAQQYGASIKGVYEVSQLYYQQGLQTAEVMNLTEETLKMAKIANLDYAEATDYMTVALRGFKLEMSDAQQVTDVYSALAAATASDTEELAVAMSKTASSAEAVGSSFESTSAMIATMISITREAPENIGSALKSIISRYGEMTSDPMKLIDSEGEEMSLNKVDKALQSVGIFLQNAQGQFRDFDDVILELSKTWNTIDTNTQRYIATVMAGNRQQSRFLALVGNYEEYAKALEVAENAEDAGTLQTLKTMDSISTKWEQLKVSLQEFYTSAGLEDVFKGVLDALNTFLTKANDIPKLFGKIPVSVIALVSSLITSIKNVATSLTSAVVGPISDFSKKLDEIRQKGNIDTKIKTTEQTPTAKEQIDANKAYGAANPITQKIIVGSNTNTAIPLTNKIFSRPGAGTDKYKQALEKANQVKNKAINTENEVSKALEKTNNLYSKGQKFVSKYAGTISLLASTFSALALTIKDSSNSTIEWSKSLSGFANVAAGAVLAYFGQWQYAIPMLISGIPTLIDGIIYTTEEKLKNATEKATELSNISLQKKSDYKNLKNETKELENLTEARHDSAEAYQEWLDYNNQMASSYPELISYIDSEGNAIIDLAASYQSLELARLAAAKAAKDSVFGNIEQANISSQNADEKITNFDSLRLSNSFNETVNRVQSKQQSYKNSFIDYQKTSENILSYLPSDFIIGSLEELIGAVANGESLGNYDTASSLLNQMNSVSDAFYGLEDLETFIAEEITFTNDEINETFKGKTKEAFDKYYETINGNITNEDFYSFLSSPETISEIQQTIIDLKKQNKDNIYNDEISALEEMVRTAGEYNKLLVDKALADKQLAASQREAISTFAYYDNEASTAEVGEELNNFNEIATNYLVKQWKKSGSTLENYLTTQESIDYQNFEKEFQKIWGHLSSSQQTSLNELLASSENYDFSNYQAALADFGITQGIIYNELTAQWYEEYGQAYFNFIDAISSRQEKDSSYLSKGISQLQNIAPKYYDEILDFYDKVNLQVSDGLISQLQGSDILDAYSSLWQQSKGLENEAEIQKILAEGDFTSLDGIYSLKESLKKAGFDANTILENLANSINVNVLTEWETFGQKVKTGLESFTEALTNATEGMDYEDAINMASKLEMSLSDFRFEDGEYFLDDIEAIQKVYGNFGEELKKTLITETDKELNTLLMQRESAYKMGDYKTAADLSSQMAEIQTAQENAESSVNEYIAYHTNLAYLTAGLYDGFIQQIGGSGSVAEMLAAGRESDTKLREYLLALGNENITEETVDGYVAAITDRISSVNESILSLILDKNVGKGGSVDISHLVEKTDLEGFTKITAEKIPELFAKMFGENYEAYNDAMLQYMEDSSANISEMIADLAGDIEHIDYSSVFEIANALGKNVNEIIGLFTDNLDGTFSTSLNNIQTLAQIAGIGITSEIQDAIREYLDNILGIVSNGISGSMTNVEFDTLENFMSLDLDFTETSEGLKLTKASAIEVYTELKKIDSIQAQITFSDLAESLEEAGSGYEDVASIMKTIAELNEEIADVPVDSKRREELERELDVAKEILRVRSQDPDSFDFMGKDLPDALKGPENYWNSVGEAYKVMNEASQSGYMEIQDYVNIVRQMEAMATAAGQDFSIGGMNAAQLIQKGLSSLSNIDGEGVKIAMEGVGIDFANAATDMGLSFDDGIKEMAKSQIKMLDAAIRMLEAMVAMENIDANSDGLLDFGEIFKEGTKESGWDEDVVEWADNLEDAAGRITIGGKSLLDALMTLEPEQIKKALNQLMSIDWTLGDTDIASQIQNVLSAYFPDVDITQGKSVFDILEIPDDADTKAEHFTEWLNKVGLAAENYDLLKKTLDNNYKIGTGGSLFQSIEKMLGLEEGDNRFENLYNQLKNLGYGIQDAIKIWDEITVTDEDGKTTYTYNGTDYTDLESALAARNISDKTGQTVKDVEVTTEGETVITTGTIQVGNGTFTVSQSGEEIWYTSSDGACKSNDLRKVIDYEVSQKVNESGIGTVEAYAQYGVDITAEGLANVSISGIKEALSQDLKIDRNDLGEPTIIIDGELITFEAGTTDEQIRQKLMEAIGIDASQVETIVTAISTAISTADWSPVGKAISEALTGKVKTEGGVAEGIEIGELILKPAGLKVDASEAGEPTLLNAGEDLTTIPVNSVTLKPIDVDIDTSEFSLSESITSGLTISIPENLNADSVDLINQFNSAISAAAANATVNSGITITITGLDGDQVSNIENYNKAVGNMPSGTTTSEVEGIVSISAIDLLHIMQLKNAVQQLKDDPNVNSTITATAEGNAIAVIQDILAVYGYDGKTAELIFNALDNNTIDDIITELDEVVGKDITITANLEDSEAQEAIEDLVKPETKLVTIQYTNPTGVGPETDTSTIGYEVYGYDNLNGNFSRLGRYDNAEQTIDAVTAAVSIGTFQDGNFEITEIKADGTTATITATSVDLISGAVSLGGSGGGSTPKTQTSGTDSSSGNAGGGNIGAFDLSGLTAQIQAVSSEANIAATNISSTASALSSIDTSPIDTAKTKITSLANASRNVSSSGASRINAISAAIRNIPSSKTISISYSISVSVSASGPNVTGATGRIIGGSGISSFGKNSASGSLAKGNYSGKALASGRRKTLMGELGPELVVSGGRYFLVGQNGAEFVDLADDAIVFNHLQTAKLIKHGRAGTGKPITNETNAVSFATGNVDGPAMASASAALAQLRQIRAMWQALLDASISDLGSKAGLGKGGGGGSGGGGGDADNSAIPYDLEKWYNWLRKIAQLEQEITLEQAKRENMASGYDRANSLSRELSLLEKQLAVEKDLAGEQEAYYKARAKEVNNSAYGQIFTFDENGLMQFREEEGLGLDFITKIKNEEKATDQLKIIASLGFDTGDDLLYDENGQKIDTSDMKPEEIAKAKVENFFNNVDLTKEELEELYDSVYEHQIKIEELAAAQLEIQQERVDNQLEVEQMIYDTIVDMKEAEIKGFEEQKEAIQEASEDYLEGLNKALDKELAMYNKNAEQEETTKLQRRLSILQRSGGSASEIRALQEQIDSRLKDEYFQEQQDQIDAIQEASDREIERLDKQINILTETLDYEKENGLIWDQVAEWLQKPEDEILSFITSWNQEFLDSSLLGQEEFFKEAQKILQQYFGDQKWIQAEEAAEKYVNEMTQEGAKYHGASDDIIAQAKEAYKNSYHEDQDATKAQEEADKILNKILQDNTNPPPSTDNENVDNNSKQQGRLDGGQMNVRTKASGSSKSKGIVYSSRTFEAVGYENGWLKVENAQTSNRAGGAITLANGYMKYKGYEKYYKDIDISKLPGFSRGGLVDYTGLAMVHGSKTKPESFISAEHTKLLKSTIFSPHNNALEKLREVYENYKSTSSGINNSNDSNINIENVNISVETGAISNGYDARRAGQEIFDEMVRISRKTANVKVSRR